MIFFFKSDGTLIKSAPETVYQGSEEAGKVYVVAPLNSNMLVDVYYELPNGERWGAYLLENNGTVINNEELPDGWALWSTTLESAITQYAGTLKAQFGFYQSGTADKVPLITSQGVTITIAKGVVRDLPSVPTANVYAQIVNAISSIKQDIANLPNEYLSNTNEDKIALKNNSAIEYSENYTAGTIVKRDIDGKINVADGTEDLNAVNIRQFNAALANKVSSSSVSNTAVKDTIAQRTSTGQLKAADGVADDDLATVKQLNAVKQGNYSDITNIELNTGYTTVEYDTELGITVNAKGTLTHKNGSTEQPTTKFEVPIIAGAGVSLDKKKNEEKIEIKSLNSNLENGTANVLIQTTDTNHSFKVMTDGRAKVQSAPVEDDDVVRKYELYTKFDKTNIVQATGDSTTDVMSQKAVTDELEELKAYLIDRISYDNSLYGLPFIEDKKVKCNKVIDGGTATYFGVDCLGVQSTIITKFIMEKGTITGSVAIISLQGEFSVASILNKSFHLVINSNTITLTLFLNGEHYVDLISTSLLNQLSLDGITENTVTVYINGEEIDVVIDNGSNSDTYHAEFIDENYSLSSFMGNKIIFEHYCYGDRNNVSMPMFTYAEAIGERIFTEVKDNFNRPDGLLNRTPNGLQYHCFSNINTGY